MTRKSLFARTFVVAGTFLFIASGFGAAHAAQAAEPAAATGAAPIARVLMVDLRRVMAVSKVGQDIQKQVAELKKKAQDDLASEGKSLQSERTRLEQQAAILAPAVKARKARDYDAKVSAFQKKLQQRSSLIQGGVLKAQQQVEQALGPILQGVMQERHATILLDRQAVLLAPNAIDVTADVVRRLNLKMSTVKVVPSPLPENVRRQQEQAAEQ